MDKEKEIVKQLQDGIKLKKYLQRESKTLLAIAQKITEALRNGNKVLTFGNGGSAADAQHIAAELAGRFYHDRDSLPAIALTTNTSTLTAIANDYGYETIFARQLKGLVNKGDIAIAISVGGNSPNVVLGIEEAKKQGAITVGLVGKGGGKLKEIADYIVTVPSTDTPRVQEAHITIGHIICYLVEDALFGDAE